MEKVVAGSERARMSEVRSVGENMVAIMGDTKAVETLDSYTIFLP